MSEIDKLSLLEKLSDAVYTTLKIKTEYGAILPDSIKIKSSKNNHYQQILEIDLGKEDFPLL